MDTSRTTIAPGDEAASFCATLVDEWIRMGVRHAVVAPGSRSTPMAVALARRGEIEIHIFHDERSASFAALGVGLATAAPAVLLCTSGTAATHFHGAVVEAHQSDVPMIVCTADRPPELRDVGAPQTIDQTNLFGSAVRWFHDPGVPAVEASSSWRALAARAWNQSRSPRPGPVHLNLPFREPLLGSASLVPPARDGGWTTMMHEDVVDERAVQAVADRLSGRRGVIVAGHGSTSSTLDLADALSWPVFADARSGLRERRHGVVIGFDPLLRCESFIRSRSPEVVLRVGAPPASKVLSQWVTGLGVDVVQITPSPMVTDPDHNVSVSVTGDVGLLAQTLSRIVSATPDVTWRQAWAEAEETVQAAISTWTAENMAEPTVARIVSGSMTPGSNLVISSSMPIRDLEWFGGPTPGVAVHSNRGTNGIDGVVSTTVGVALATSAPTTLLIGDVAFIHDSNGMWGLTGRAADVRIVVVNNDGGSIFSFLPQASALDDATFELLFGTPHGVSLANLVMAHGLTHLVVSDAESLATALSRPGPIVIEVPFERAGNVADHERLNTYVNDAISQAFTA